MSWCLHKKTDMKSCLADKPSFLNHPAALAEQVWSWKEIWVYENKIISYSWSCQAILPKASSILTAINPHQYSHVSGSSPSVTLANMSLPSKTKLKAASPNSLMGGSWKKWFWVMKSSVVRFSYTIYERITCLLGGLSLFLSMVSWAMGTIFPCPSL